MKSFYRLTPAYRHGKDTPWGGDALRRIFGKDIPDSHTGEALEASTLKGLESRVEDGRTLTEVAGGELPLLLKLIDAQEALSVQVHPDDAYAAAHEGGKLGKTEAWLVLHADPGARLVYGLLPGTDVTRLSGKEIEAHLRWVAVHEGDVLYIPAGMVHAIGGGIVLYEIQQTSDVTYRFWDWDRRDQAGNPRALHWDKACDVARVDLQLEAAKGEERAVEGGRIIRYLQTPYFILDRILAGGDMPLAQEEGFQYITALGDCVLDDGQESIRIWKGDTVYIPPRAAGIRIKGRCALLRSMEGK